MYLPVPGDERSSALESMTHNGLRRRRRSAVLDVQTARCPRCGQPLVVLQAVGGPAFFCGCGRRRSASAGRLP